MKQYPAVLCLIAILCLSIAKASAAMPAPDELSKAVKKMHETISDIGDAFVGTIGRGNLQQDKCVMQELRALADVNLERLQHLWSLAILHKAATDTHNAKLLDTINLLAQGNASRIEKELDTDLKSVATAIQDAKDPGVVSVAGNVRDRLREVRDLWQFSDEAHLKK